MTTAERGSPGGQRTVSRFFAEPVRDYVLQSLGRPVSVLQAGCLAPLRELGIGELTDGGFAITVTAVDADDPVARRVLRESRGAYDDVITGDLRTVSISPRSYDVVYCAQLLERVQHVALVLDRLNSALKPGGLLLIRTADRYSATALLDRLLPGPARRMVWSRLRPGVPGPFPPVYEKAVSAAGIADYALMRGLVIAARASELTRPHQPSGLSSSMRITCGAIARLSRGRYGDSHDELLYVIRKPQDRFARVVLPPRAPGSGKAGAGDGVFSRGHGRRTGGGTWRSARGACHVARLDTGRGAARRPRAAHLRRVRAADRIPHDGRPRFRGRARRARRRHRMACPRHAHRAGWRRARGRGPPGAPGPGGVTARGPQDQRTDGVRYRLRGRRRRQCPAAARRASHHAARARARAVPRAAPRSRRGSRHDRQRTRARARDQAPARPAADRAAKAPGRPAARPGAAAAARGGTRRACRPSGGTGPRGPRRSPPAPCEHACCSRSAPAAERRRAGAHRPCRGRRRLRGHPPPGRWHGRCRVSTPPFRGL